MLCVRRRCSLIVLLKNCDLNNVWRFLPSFLVLKAFWLSLLTLGLCDLAQIATVMVAENDGAPLTNKTSEEGNYGVGTKVMKFGLWGGGFSSNLPDSDDKLGGDDDEFAYIENEVEDEMEKITVCQFRLANSDGPGFVFLDAFFRSARAFGIITVAVGFLSMIVLWTSACKGSSSTNVKRCVGVCLMLCCAFEGLTLLILRAGICKSPGDDSAVPRTTGNCTIAEGATTIITACVFWFLTGLALIKVPPEAESIGDEDSDGDDISLVEHLEDETPPQKTIWQWLRIFLPCTSPNAVDISRYTLDLTLQDGDMNIGDLELCDESGVDEKCAIEIT